MDRVVHVPPGITMQLEAGDYFSAILPDGRTLHFQQTGDDFSITNSHGMVVYSRGTSDVAKHLFPFNADRMEN